MTLADKNAVFAALYGGSTKAIVSKIKRNTRVLEEIEKATDLRVAYKTEKGWKRLIVPAPSVESLRSGASTVVKNRLDKLVPAAIDAVLNGLVDELNR